MLIVLTLAQLVVICGFIARYAFTQGGTGLRVFAIGVTLFTLLTLGGLVLRRAWKLWATLVAVSLMATIDLFAWAQNDRVLASVSFCLLVIMTVLIFRTRVDATPFVSPMQRVLFGCVLGFAAWVAFWGLLRPADAVNALPFAVPPLHARFLGAMYLSGAVGLTLNLMAREWAEVRVITTMLAIWTGMLGLVSLVRFAAFDWSRAQVWFWFFAYICFPLVAAWITWCQRTETNGHAGRALPPGIRTYLLVQGILATLLAVVLLLAPAFMKTVWPWAISPLLTQLYGAPFLSYGLGSIYAARQRTWSEVRTVVAVILVFALSVLGASIVHARSFNFHSLAAWIWFGGFTVASLFLLVRSAIVLRTRR
ncbi:MAG: hypothetical protein JO263_02385 [Candidatus Eremiobacteraeota bacterium]|nr:hypothetical protein [Candidatus Eremiobacteraeota bacterium]